MKCDYVELPNGSRAIVCTSARRGAKQQKCACGKPATIQCDWKLPQMRDTIGKQGTCDRHICEKCALEVAPDKHLCGEHVFAYRRWQSKQAMKEKLKQDAGTQP